MMKSEAEKEAGSILLKEYGQFFKTQYQELVEIVGSSGEWENNKSYLPIQMILEPNESISIIELVSSDNTLMTKILGVFTSLCMEVLHLKKEAFDKHIPFLSIYEEYKDSVITEQIDAICQLSAFVTRCDDTLKNMFSQLFALYTEGIINLNGVELHFIINHIGELFAIIVLIELLLSNTTLIKNWKTYKKSLQNYARKTEDSNFGDDELKSIMGAIENISSKIMTDNIVQNSLNNLLTLRSKLVDKNCSVVTAEFTQYVKLVIVNLDKLVQEKPYANNMYKCIKVNSLFVLNSYLFGINDKKVFRLLIDLNVKAHSIPIAGNTIWFPEQFLQRYLPSLCAAHGRLQQTMLKARQTYLANKKSSIARDEQHLLNICLRWILSLEKYFNSTHTQLNASEISINAKIILSCLDIASHTNYTLLTFINLHVTLGVPLSKNTLSSIFHVLEVIKTLKYAIMRNYNSIINSINMIIQHLIFQAISAVGSIKKYIMSDKNYANQRLDELTCTVVAERALKGAGTIERNVAANVALSLLPNTTYTEENRTSLGTLLEKIHTLINYMSLMNQYCDCSWIFWHQNIIPIYLAKNFLTNSTEVVRLKNFFFVLEDCAILLHNVDKQFGVDKSNEFLDNIKVLIDENILKSSSQQIETNLRLHIHSHLQLDVANPFTNEMIKKSLLYVDNFRLLQTYISVVPSVEHYLSTMYYNLTTVVLSDWKTYGEMRQMATFKFNLKTVEDNLPTQTLEQGLDVLEIMRNIHIFVSKYLYNLNNQIFIEKSSNNKHLNSINIRHIANSIRTHGTGIMNTTVNFTYQFLKKKFYTFSQFMYDEHIKSRLMKDLKIFKDTAVNNGNMYSYRNAEKFNKGIRNLGLAEDGQSYLDLFRDLISQIGNAMGYVRMIRSGGRHCCADATVFLPSLEVDKKFKDLAEECELNATTKTAAEILDNNIESLTSNFTKGTEYFKLLVDAFAPVFRNPKNIHLNNFYIIVPPLTLNFVEHLILAKDKMTKKNKVGAAFTDDGFAMGIAYILKLLDQDSSFESLHWFESIWKHIADERKSLEDQKAKGSIQLQQALALTEKKLITLEQEFNLLYYSLSSARIFFR